MWWKGGAGRVCLCVSEEGGVTGGQGSPERLMQDEQGRRWSVHQDIRQMLGGFRASTARHACV